MSKTKEEISGPPVPVSPAGLPISATLLEQIQADARAGLEDASSEDKALPFIGIVQSMSPQRDKQSPRYVPGAEEGDLFNTVTSELFKGGITVVPVYFRKHYIEWVPRDEGGGFVGSFPTREATKATQNLDNRKWYTENGNEIVDTAEHYVLVQSADGTWSPALISMTSSKLKVSRQWNTRMAMVRIPKTSITPPVFAKAYRLRTTQQSNDKGRWFNFVLEDVPGFVDEETYVSAKMFRESLLAGAVKVNYNADPNARDEETDPDNEDGGKGKF